MNVDMSAMPKPEAATTKISTNSLRRLKYWATIKVEVSRVKPTPIPKMKWKRSLEASVELKDLSTFFTCHDGMTEE